MGTKSIVFWTSLRTSSRWQAIIGLEIHAQINSNTKLFSHAQCVNEAPVNTTVSLFDLSTPGTLPVLNKRCVEAAVLTGTALNCKISKISTFDRKHYFYADQPAGYQITQYFHPIASAGSIDYFVYHHRDCPKPLLKSCQISRLQIEQDTGKTLNDDKRNVSWIDLNRCGVGLMEIVTDHTLSSGLEAACLVRELQLLLQALDTCRARMEKGELRVDANVSVKKADEELLRTRTEIKNLNSLRFIRKAIDFEISRHVDTYERGERVKNETFAFDFRTNRTVLMRDKEIRQDYRYMPEPNLPPLRLYDNLHPPPESLQESQYVNMDTLLDKMPSLPRDERNRRLQNDKLSPLQFCQILDEPTIRDHYANCVDTCKLKPLLCAELLLNALPGALKRKWLDLKRLQISADDVSALVKLVQEGQLSVENFKRVIRMLNDGDKRPAIQIFDELDLKKITDSNAIENLCKSALAKGEAQELLKRGLGEALNVTRLVGVIQRETNYKIDKEAIEACLKKIF